MYKSLASIHHRLGKHKEANISLFTLALRMILMIFVKYSRTATNNIYIVYIYISTLQRINWFEKEGEYEASTFNTSIVIETCKPLIRNIELISSLCRLIDITFTGTAPYSKSNAQMIQLTSSTITPSLLK